MSENLSSNAPDENNTNAAADETVAHDAPEENSSNAAANENVSSEAIDENSSTAETGEHASDDEQDKTNADAAADEKAATSTASDEAIINSLMQELGSSNAKTRRAAIGKYDQRGISDERIDRVLRELAQTDPAKNVREAAAAVLRKQVTGQFFPAKPDAAKTQRPSPNNRLMLVLLTAVVLFALCVAGTIIFSVVTDPEAIKPTPNAEEVAIRATADTIVQENAQAAVTLTAMAMPQNTDAPTVAQPQNTAMPTTMAQQSNTKTPTAAQPRNTEIPTETLRPNTDTPTAAPQLTNTLTPTATETLRSVYAIGETIRAGNWEYTVNRIQKAQTLIWGNPANKAQAKGTFLLVYLTLKNTGGNNVLLNASDLTLKDADGKVYAADISPQAASFIQFSKLAKLGDQFPSDRPLNTALIYDLNPEAQGLHLYLGQTEMRVNLGE